MTYTYQAALVRVVDGDTVDMTVDLGFRTSVTTRFRLRGIDAPELTGDERPDGVAAAGYLAGLMPPGSTWTIDTFKDPDKYGRWLVVIHTDGGTVNDRMVEDGYAEPYVVKP